MRTLELDRRAPRHGRNGPGTPPRRRRRERRGSIAVFVLVCLVAIVSIAGVILRVGLAERRRLEGEGQRLQVDWLLESGLDRAGARLARAADYGGEIWEVEASELGGRDAGRVTITIAPVASTSSSGASRRVRVRVQAEYPRGASTPVRSTKEVFVTLDSKPKGGTP